MPWPRLRPPSGGVTQAVCQTIGEQIRQYLGGLPTKNLTERDTWPPEATQDGIAEGLGIARAHACLELKKLEARGLVERIQAHVREARNRRLVYRVAHGPLVRVYTEEGKSLPLVPGHIVEIKVVTLRCPHCGQAARVALGDP